MDVSRAVESASGPGPLFGHGPLPTGAALDVVSFKWVSGVLPRIIFITTPSRLVEMPLLLAKLLIGTRSKLLRPDYPTVMINLLGNF